MDAANRLWRPAIRPGLGFGLVLVCAATFAGMRYIGMFGPTSLRWALPLSFTIMALLPWILLGIDGRRRIGLRRANALRWLPAAIAAGALASLACFALGLLLFGHSADNWFVSVAANYRRVMNTADMGVVTLHLVFTLPATLFSPIGEELFFRGTFQEALEQRFSANKSTAIESAVFGLVHLCHHGLLLGAAGLSVRPVSGTLWVLLMFSVAWMFATLRKRSGSLYPAMASHATFNVTMNLAIFAWLWF